MATAEVWVETLKKKQGKSVVTSGGVALVDAAGAARLLKSNGILESAKQHMHFHTVVVKRYKKPKLESSSYPKKSK